MPAKLRRPPEPGYAMRTLQLPDVPTDRGVVVVVVVVIVVGLFDYDNDNDNDNVPGISVTTSVLIAPRCTRSLFFSGAGNYTHRLYQF